MFAIICSSLVVVAGSLLAGQAICAACGFRAWTPVAPAAGLSAMMAVCVPALHLPGRLVLPGLAIAAATVAGAALAWRRPGHRPPLAALAAALVAGAVAMVPFLASGRGGILGVSLNNDMASHLLWASAYRSEMIQQVNGLIGYYPVGPHALSATLDAFLGVGIDGAMTGFTVACPLLTATIAYGLLRDVPAPAAGRLVAAVLAALSCLGAAYMGEGAFKEVGIVALLLGCVAALTAERRGETGGRWRLVPLGVIGVGILSLYSLPGLAWPVVTAALVGGALALRVGRAEGAGPVVAAARALVAPLAVGAGVAAVLLVPQAARIYHFYQWSRDTGIAVTDIGNLAGPLSPFQATGMWLSADFRFPPADPVLSKLAGVVLLAAALWGAVRAVRAGAYELPAAAVAGTLLWWYADRTQSPYTAAKALVIVSPLLILLAARGLLERRPAAGRALTLAPVALWAALAAFAVVSSFLVLRWSPVGPDAHARDLAALRPLIQRQTALFLGFDDFAQWELAGARVYGADNAPKRAEKPWTYGKPFDFDTLMPKAYDGFAYVVAPVAAVGSSVPSNLTLVRRAGAYALYRRTGPTPRRRLLAEGPDAPGAPLDCSSPLGRRLRRDGGTAAVRSAPLSAAVPAIPQGGSITVPLQAGAGRWIVDLAYMSPQELRVRGPGLDARVPANLDRPGTLWPVGRLDVPPDGAAQLTITAAEGLVHAPLIVVPPSTLWLTRPGGDQTVPLAQACGRYVDWYLPAG